MKYILIIALGIFCLANRATATINGFAVNLYGSGPAAAYTVPTNKVLIIQQVALPQGASSANSIIVAGATVSLLGANTNGLYRFQTPLYLPAGTTISSSASGTGIFGLLVDVTDMPLFAGVGSSVGNITIAANTLSGVIQLPTSDPVVVRFQSSPDLVNWQYDASVVVQPGPDKTKLMFSVPTTGAGLFYRASVHRRCGV
jgi:hypothetical protein